MPEPIGQIPVEITGDWEPLKKALQEAENLARAGASSIASGFNSAMSGLEESGQNIALWLTQPMKMAEAAMGDLVNAMGPLGLVGAAAASALAAVGAAITHVVLEAGEAAETTSNFAAQLNLSFEEARKLSDMADIAGVNVGGLARVSMMLADALEDSHGKGKKVAEALAGMGIAATDSGDALLQVLKKLSEIPDATERIAKAHEIMGRSAIALEPMLRDYKALGEMIDELGHKLDKEAVAKLLAADDAAGKLGKAFRNLKEDLAIAFAPSVISGLNLLSSILTKGPDVKMAEGMLSGLGLLNAATKKLGDTTEDTAKKTAALAAYQHSAQKSMEYQADLAFKRSEEYNKELDRSNELGKKAAEAAKKHAEELAKQNREYNNLLATFPKVANAVTALRNIDMAKFLATPPGGWFDVKADLANLDRIHDALTAMEKLEGPKRAAANIKEFIRSFSGIKEASEAMKSLGNSFSEKMSDALAKTGRDLRTMIDLFNEGRATATDVQLAWNNDAKAAITLADATRRATEEGLQLSLRWKELSGADGQKVIEQLVNTRLHTESLMIATHTLGDLYDDLTTSFLNVFDNLDKGLVRMITGGASIGDTIKGIAKSLEVDLVSSFTHALTQGLKKAFIDSGVGQAVSKFLKDTFGGLFGGLFKTAGEAPAVAATTANTTALAANTAAITALTGALGAQGATSAAAGAASGAGGGGGLGSLGGLAGGVSAVAAVAEAAMTAYIIIVLKRMEKDVARIEVSTRGQLNQLIALQGTLNTYLPQLADRTLGIWAESIVTSDILRLIGQSGGGIGDGKHTGADPEMAQHIADVVNASASVVAESYDNLSSGLQTTASSAYSLDEAVVKTTSSLLALDDATREIRNGAVPPAMVDAVAAATAETISSNPEFMQGAMMPHQNNQIGYATVAPVITGGQVMRGGDSGATFGSAAVAVYAVDPSGRQIAKATTKGLEEIGVRTR